jgi:hypothetical protein
MIDIDFKKIRGDSSNGQRGGFEEFVCQLARQNHEPSEGNFRRIDGSGGDGGVEAYWQLNNGTKVGFQAKYWLSSRAIDWRQIDRSVKKALTTHAKLIHYYIAIPCDLTEKSGTKGKGKPGWKHWEKHKQEWENFAASQGMKVKFIPWTASDLTSLTIERLSSGAIKYWFDVELLPISWFEDKANKAIQDLGMRYQPKFNVDTSVIKSLDTFCKDRTVLRNLELKTSSDMRELMFDLDEFVRKAENGNIKRQLGKFHQKVDQFSNQLEAFFLDANLNILFDWSDFFQTSTDVVNELFDISEKIKSLVPEPDTELSETAQRIIRGLRYSQANIENGIYQIWNNILDDELKPYASTCFTLSGTFGKGKSHALGRFIETQIKHGRPALLLLGQQFAIADPKQQILEKLDSTHLSFSELLEAMNSASESAGHIGIIAIDALNEGGGLEIWKNHLAGLLEDIEKHDYLRLVISYRSEYEDMLAPENVISKAFSFKIEGFEDGDDFERACTVLMDDFGIQRPTSSFLPPAFYNPLFLTQICKWLKENGKDTFPDGLEGMATLMGYYLNNVVEAVQHQFNLSSTISEPMRNGFKALAEHMASERLLWTKRDTAERILSNTIQSPPPTGKTWLQILLDTGSLRADLDPGVSQGPFASPKEVIRLSFQAFEEYLIAYELWNSLNGEYKNTFDQDGPLGFILHHQQLVSTDWPFWDGVLMAFGVILAEEDGVELIDLMTDDLLSQHPIQALFENGLYWRSANSITDRTIEILKNHSHHVSFFNVLSSFSLVKDHPLNAHMLHNQLTGYESMAERDAIWTDYVNLDSLYESKVTNKLKWLKSQKSNVEKETAELSAIFLTWQLTSTFIPHRDQSSRALTNLFIHNPKVISTTLRHFKDVDDLYLQERLYSSVYGACHFVDTKYVRLVAEEIYNLFFSREVPLHILLRDTAQGIIERAKFIGALPCGIDIVQCQPPWNSVYSLEFHSDAEIKHLASSLGDTDRVIARSCVTETRLNQGLYGDFGRYIVKTNTDVFNLPTSESNTKDTNHDGDLIGNWIAHRAYNYGWREELFPHDNKIDTDDSKGKLERIGKKYQWIAMYELLGILADHCDLADATEKSSTLRKYKSIDDLPRCRTKDPTLATIPEQYKIPELDCEFPVTPMPEYGVERKVLENWISESDRLKELDRNIEKTDKQGNEWTLIYHYMIDWKEIYTHTPPTEVIPNTSIASRLSAFVVKKSSMDNFIKDNVGHRQPVSLSSIMPYPVHQGTFQYLYERDWRSLDKSPKISDDKITPNLQLVNDYYYPIQNDNDFTDPFITYLPTSSIIAQQQLTLNRQFPNILVNPKNQIVFYSTAEYQNFQNRFGQAWIRTDVLNQFLIANDLSCVWLADGKKYFHYGIEMGEQKDFYGVISFEMGKRNEHFWSKSIG